MKYTVNSGQGKGWGKGAPAALALLGWGQPPHGNSGTTVGRAVSQLLPSSLTSRHRQAALHGLSAYSGRHSLGTRSPPGA